MKLRWNACNLICAITNTTKAALHGIHNVSYWTVYWDHTQLKSPQDTDERGGDNSQYGSYWDRSLGITEITWPIRTSHYTWNKTYTVTPLQKMRCIKILCNKCHNTVLYNKIFNWLTSIKIGTYFNPNASFLVLKIPFLNFLKIPRNTSDLRLCDCLIYGENNPHHWL